MYSTKEKGDLAIASAINYFMTNNYEVCLPIGDKKEYDIIVEKEGIINRVQVKYAGLYPSRNNTCRAALRITGGNQSFNTAKKYKNEDFELLYIYTAKNERYLMPWNEITARNEIYVEHNKYQRYNVSSLQS